MEGIGFTQDVEFAKLRERLQRMTDAQLVEFGKAARFMCSPGANLLAIETRHFINGGRSVKVEQQVEKDCPRIVQYVKTDAAKREIDL